jgi:hypothetical protein
MQARLDIGGKKRNMEVISFERFCPKGSNYKAKSDAQELMYLPLGTSYYSKHLKELEMLCTSKALILVLNKEVLASNVCRMYLALRLSANSRIR